MTRGGSRGWEVRDRKPLVGGHMFRESLNEVELEFNFQKQV